MNTRNSEEVLQRAYGLVATKLRDTLSSLDDIQREERRVLEQLAALLDVKPARSSPPGDEGVLTRLAWLPVAEQYVVSFLRALLSASSAGGAYSREQLERIWGAASPPEELAAAAGLPTRHANLAFKLTVGALLDPGLFGAAATLRMNGAEYSVACHGGESLTVEPCTPSQEAGARRAAPRDRR